MERLSIKKQVAVIRLYLSGLSYSQISAQTGVSKGAVAGLVAELKAGRFPEVPDISAQVETLRELAVDLAKAKLAPGQALAGVAVLSRLQELGVEPGDIHRWAVLCRHLAPQGTGVTEFVNAAMAFDEVRQRTGLDPEALEKKVRQLEEQATQLEARVQALSGQEQKLLEVEARRKALEGEVAELEKRLKPLSRSVVEKEQREAELARCVREMEERAQAADERLASARRDLQTLAALGLSTEGIGGLVQRISAVAQRHQMSPVDMQGRLLCELEALDAGISLEAKVSEAKVRLTDEEQAVARASQERAALEAANRRLKEEQAALHAQMEARRRRLSSEMAAIAKAAQVAASSLQQKLKASIDEAIGEVHRLKEQGIELGKQIGLFDAAVRQNRWVEGLLALVKGKEGVAPADARVVSLSVLRGLARWTDRNTINVQLPVLLSTYVQSTVQELERWRP